MSALKFLTIATGIKKLVSALTSSAGIGDANKIIATNSAGKLDPSFLPTGVELVVETIVTSEVIAAGDFVNIWDDTGTRKVRKADAATARPAHGFVLSGASSGANASVYLTGLNTQVSGYTAGAKIFLSDITPGTGSATPPIESTGYINQILGVAASTTSLRFEFDDPIEYA